jgi:hypothetical protein
MMKMKLLTVVLIILSAIGVALAVEVINVDLNGYISAGQGDDRPYVGSAAYVVDANTVWTVYYGGFGMPVGSARSEGLRRQGQGAYPTVYASQVWIGDDGENHTYKLGTALMDDGFVANAGFRPKINIFGRQAYTGVYDIYVYGSDEGDFTLSYYGVPTTKKVTGGVAPGAFVNGENYVVFENVDVNNENSNDVYIDYNSVINGFQFVRKKDPCEIYADHNTPVWATTYDVAGERNMDEPLDTGLLYGPDIAGNMVSYARPPEFMIYDINVNKDNEGQYQIGLDVNTKDYDCPRLAIYLDDKFLHDVNRPKTADPCALGLTTTASANLFAGRHTVEWLVPPGTEMYSNIVDVNFTYIGDINMVDCNDVIFYGFLLPGDYSKDCKVGYGDIDNNWRDLGPMLDNWMNCNNPDANDCF